MPTIILDFNTKLITPDKRVWVIFPGENYKFYEHFLEQSVVFADLPGFLIKRFDIEDDESLKRWLALSEATRSFYVERKGADSRPSRSPEDYKRRGWTGRRINAKGVVRGLYGRAKKGDLVLFTSRGGAWGKTHIGEITDDPANVFYTHYPRYSKNGFLQGRLLGSAA